MRSQRIAGMLRGMAGLSQRRFAEKVGLHPRQIAAFEGGEVEPTPQELQRIAQLGMGMTVADAEELLRQADAMARYRERQQEGRDEALPALMDRLQRQLSDTFLRLLALPGPQTVERRDVEELMGELRACTPEARIWLVRAAEEFQSRELCERVREEAAREAERGGELAAVWAQIAEEIAVQVAGTEGKDASNGLLV